MINNSNQTATRANVSSLSLSKLKLEKEKKKKKKQKTENKAKNTEDQRLLWIIHFLLFSLPVYHLALSSLINNIDYTLYAV